MRFLKEDATMTRMTGYVKKPGGYEKRHEPSYKGATMNLPLDLETVSTIKLDGSDAPFVGVFSYAKKQKIARKFYYFIPIFLQKIGYAVFFVLHKIFVRIEIKGRENLLNINGPIILAPNHTGELDVTAIPLIFPFFSNFFPIYFTTNPDDEYKGSNNFGWRSFVYGGRFFDLLGGCQIYSGHKNYAISLQNHIALLTKGNTVCIFPEGHMTLDGEINRAHGGLGYLVYITGTTVVPVAIDSFYGMSWKKYFSFRKKVNLTICKPMFKNEVIDTQNPTVLDFRAGSQKVLDRIREVIIK